MSRILVVDDKEMMRDSVATTLSRKGHTVIAAPGGQAALKKIAERRPDLVVTDLQMPGMSGLDLLEEIRRIDDQIPVVFMTAYGTVETAVQAMKQGAFDYITKPFSGDELVVAVTRALEHGKLVRENQVLKAATSRGGRTGMPSHAMVGDGQTMNALRERLAMIADSHGTVLISGESGSGKEVAARWIHARSPRAALPFLAINCAALSSTLLESELFGHEKGAFTGADKLRKGRFELADGGTLLLDEISEIAPSVQAKLLRVLQEQMFERVGSSTPLSVDVRVIATTNRNLSREVAAGNFRQDLFYRLNVLPVVMPTLRERVEDLPELVSHFLEVVAEREGHAVKRLSEPAIEAMRRYGWPGNVRELQNICERAVVLTAGEEIAAELIAPWLNGPTPAHATGAIDRQAAAEERSHPAADNGLATSSDASLEASPDAKDLVCDGRLTLADIERETIIKTLRRHGGHRQKSAQALGIGVRTLGLKLKKWKEESLVSQGM